MASSAPSMQISAIIGNTVASNLALSSSPSGDVAYAAGSTVVVYSLASETQKRFLHGHSSKPISCLRFSPSGRHIAVGESGKEPRVYIYDVDSGAVVATLGSFHRFGVLAVCFSEADGGRYLMSVGYNNDAQIAVWDWKQRTASPLATGRCSSKLISVACLRDAPVFVTGGVRCLKYWALPSTDTAAAAKLPLPLESRGCSLKRMANSTFVDLCTTSASADYPLYAVTCTGHLCAFNAERVMAKSVNLKVSAAYSLSASAAAIAIGCSDGCIRLFHPATLEHISTAPRPHSVLAVVTNGEAPPELRSRADAYPDIVAVRQLELDDAGARALFSVGSDRSMYVWSLADLRAPAKQRAFLPHSSGVAAISSFHTGFATAGSDGSVRLWSLLEQPGSASSITACGVARPALALGDVLTSPRSSSSSSSETSGGGGDDDDDVAALINQLRTSAADWIGQIENPMAAADKSALESLRALAIDPDCGEIAVGDHDGNLYLFDLPTLACKGIVQAHQGEIRSLGYASPSAFSDRRRLLASGGRDRRVVVYRLNAAASSSQPPVEVLATFDDHSAAISGLAFAGRKLVSASSDHSLAVRSADDSADSADGECFKREALHSLSCTVADLVVHPAHTGKLLFPLRKERRVVALDTAAPRVATAEQLYTDSACEPLRLQFDNSTASYVAVASSDRCVRLHAVDAQLGLAAACDAVAVGHAEPVTGMAFSEDSSSLLTASSDGCIIRWSVPPAVLRRMQHGHAVRHVASLLPSWAAKATGAPSCFAVPVVDDQTADDSFDAADDNFWSLHRTAAAHDSRRFTIDPYDPPLAADTAPFVDHDFELDSNDDAVQPPVVAVAPNPCLIVASPKQAKQSAPVDGEVLTKRSKKLDEEVRRARQRLKEMGLIPASPIVGLAARDCEQQQENSTLPPAAATTTTSADDEDRRGVKATPPRTPQPLDCARPAHLASPSDEPLSRNVETTTPERPASRKAAASAALKRARASFNDFLRCFDELRDSGATAGELRASVDYLQRCRDEAAARLGDRQAPAADNKRENYSQMLLDLADMLRQGAL